MKQQLESKEKILIVLPQNISVDVIAAALALATLLSDTKQVTLFSKFHLPKNLEPLFNFSKFKVVSAITKPQIVVTINKKQGSVKTVKWNEKDNQIQFYIIPTDSSFEFDDVSFDITEGAYDLIVTLGCDTLESSGITELESLAMLKGHQILNIDIGKTNSKFGTVNEIGEERSLSAWLFKLLEQDNYTIQESVLRLLLQGILWANDGFRTDTSFKNVLDKFTLFGNRQLSRAISDMFNTLTIAELRYIGKMITNMTIDSEGIVVSKIPRNEFQGINIKLIAYPETFLLARLADAKASIILTEYRPKRIHVRIYCRGARLNLLQIFSKYSPAGGLDFIKFDVEGELDSLTQSIVGEIKANLKGENKGESKEPHVQKEDQKQLGRKKTERIPLKKATVLPKTMPAPAAPTAFPIRPSFPTRPPVQPPQSSPPAISTNK